MPRSSSLLLLAAASLTVACGDPSGGQQINVLHNKDGRGTKVATFGNDSVTVEELKQRFAEMSPYSRAGYQTVEKKKEYVEGLARFELLAAEAARRGMLNDPEVVETAKKVMVQRLLQKELEEKPTPVPDSEVAAYYIQHHGDYVKPEMIRLSHIFLAAPKGDAEKRAAQKAKALELLDKARAAPPMDYQSFATLVRQSSEEPRTKPLEGDMRFLSSEELAKQYGLEVAKAAGQLSKVGQLAPDVVETDAGFHVLKLQGRQSELNLSQDQVKTQIQNILIHEQKMKNYQKLLDGLKGSQNYKVDDAALAKVEIDVKAPSVEAKGPTPGFIPPPVSPSGQAPTR